MKSYFLKYLVSVVPISFCFSDYLQNTARVPQKSVLRPLLFIYTSICFAFFSLNADDTQIDPHNIETVIAKNNGRRVLFTWVSI